MNERIKELAEQAMTATTSKFSADIEWSADEWRDFYDEKFAELIVRECIELVEGYTKQRTHTTFYKAEEQIKQHFGVEE